MKKALMGIAAIIGLGSVSFLSIPTAFTAPSERKPSGGPSYELESNAAINKALWSKSVEKVVNKALKFLDDKGKNKKNWGTSQKLVTTSMVGLSFLAHGDTSDRGEYCENIRKGVEYLLDTQTEQGYLAQEGGGTMHGHGYAMTFLAEAYGTGQPLAKGTSSNRDLDKRIQKALQKAVDLSIKSQDKSGGWGYSPGSGAGHEGSITVPVVQGIRAARNVGMKVDKKIIDQGLDYMYKTYDGKGGFRYNLGSGGMGSVALGAAGATVLIMYGDQSEKTHEILKACFDRMKREAFPGRGGNGFYFYTTFYATQAMYYKGGKDWDSWYKALFAELSKKQAEDGSWTNGQYGAEFETGFMLLCLQMPNSYLPIFQKQ